MSQPRDAYAALVLKTEDKFSLEMIRLQALTDDRLNLGEMSEIVLRCNRKLWRSETMLVLDGDTISCPKCGMPTALHPKQSLDGPFVCFSLEEAPR